MTPANRWRIQSLLLALLAQALTVLPVSLAIPASLREMTDTAPANAAIPMGNLSEVQNESYAMVLAKYVDSEGMVNYKDLKEDREPLDRYVESLAVLDPNVYEQLSTDEKIAFWINAYNALTLQTIINHYPITKGGLISGLRFPENSIRQIPGVWDEISHRVMGREMTLNNIEHDTLRKQFSEPRIHMALVCASMDCPPLRREPYMADRLDAQLDDQARRFLASPRKFRIDRAKHIVYLSSIFKWFAPDFSVRYGKDPSQGDPSEVSTVLEFVSLYVNAEDAQQLKTVDHKVKYIDYDWSLNEQK